MDLIKLKMKFTSFSSVLNTQLLGTSFIYRKIKYHLPNIQQLSPIEANIELMNSPNYFVNIQVSKFMLSCLDFHNNLLSIQTDVT